MLEYVSILGEKRLVAGGGIVPPSWASLVHQSKEYVRDGLMQWWTQFYPDGDRDTRRFAMTKKIADAITMAKRAAEALAAKIRKALFDTAEESRLSEEELASLATDEAQPKRARIGQFMRDEVRGTRLEGVNGYEATAIDFKADELPGCKVGAAFRMKVRLCEPLEKSLEKRDDPTRIGSVSSSIFTEANFPTMRHGEVEVTLRAINFGEYKSNDWLDKWVADTSKALKKNLGYAPAKVESQLLQAAPRPSLDGCYPLAARGNFFTNADGHRYFLYARLYGERRYVDNTWDNPENDWNDYWCFLLVEYSPEPSVS